MKSRNECFLGYFNKQINFVNYLIFIMVLLWADKWFLFMYI